MGRAAERQGRTGVLAGRWRLIIGATAKLLLGIAALLALTAGLVVGWILLDGQGEPDRLIEAPLPDVTAAKIEAYGGAHCPYERTCRDVTLAPTAGRPVRIAVSLPQEAAAERLPTVILAGGLRTGREALQFLPDLGRNAVVTYQYPLHPDHWRRGFLPAQVAAMRSAALAVPHQLAAVVRWTRDQPWADPERVSLVGVSLGALVLPAAQRMAAAHGETVGPSILAYGGTDLGAILHTALADQDPWVARLAAWLGGMGLRALEPAAHLPHLAGPFLLISGREDPRIPAASAARLHRLTPEPKDIRYLSAGHFDADDQALLEAILALCRSWLVNRGALNP
jgi:dienelactone hydrolase